MNMGILAIELFWQIPTIISTNMIIYEDVCRYVNNLSIYFMMSFEGILLFDVEWVHRYRWITIDSWAVNSKEIFIIIFIANRHDFNRLYYRKTKKKLLIKLKILNVFNVYLLTYRSKY